MKASLQKTTLTLSLFSLFCWGVTSQTQFLKCVSKSLVGIHYLLVIKTNHIKRGDIVSIQWHDIPYVKRNLLAKRFVGLPGDKVIRKAKAIHVNSQTFPFLKATRKGEPLTPLSTTTIPKGYVFVAGDHSRSFDSRYEEFGLVPLEKVWGRAVLWW